MYAKFVELACDLALLAGLCVHASVSMSFFFHMCLFCFEIIHTIHTCPMEIKMIPPPQHTQKNTINVSKIVRKRTHPISHLPCAYVLFSKAGFFLKIYVFIMLRVCVVLIKESHLILQASYTQTLVSISFNQQQKT